MESQQNRSNAVAIVGIIVAGLLVAGAGFLYYSENKEPKVVEKQVIIEREVPAKKEEPAFSFEYKDEDGESAKIQAKDSDE